VGDALKQARRRKARGHLHTSGMGSDPLGKTRRSVMAAAGTVRSFASAPGRKVMLLLIDGWATPYSSWALGSRFPAARADVTLDRLYGPLVQAANQVGYSLYPVDLPGPRPDVLTSFGFGNPDGSPAGPVGNSTDRYVVANGGWYTDSFERRFHGLLRFLADETGGLPMINSFSNRALATTAEDMRSWYWLGFEPPRNEDDQLHEIHVRLPAYPGLRVRTRQNYLDMSRSTEVSMLVEGALLLGGSPGTSALQVSFGTPRKAGFRKLFVPMKVTVPLDGVLLLPVNGQWRNELEFRFRLMDGFGDMATPPVARLHLVIPTEPMPGDFVSFETNLLIRKRKHRYVAAVRDPLTGGILSARGEVDPAEPQ